MYSLTGPPNSSQHGILNTTWELVAVVIQEAAAAKRPKVSAQARWAHTVACPNSSCHIKKFYSLPPQKHVQKSEVNLTGIKSFH